MAKKTGPKVKPYSKRRIISIRTTEDIYRTAKMLKLNVSSILHAALFDAVSSEMKRRAAV